MNKIKIAILSDSITFPTGYRNQAWQLSNYLHNKGYEIHYFASGYQGANIREMTLEDGTKIPFMVYGQGKLPYFQDIMSNLLKQNQIDFFIVLLDTFMLWGNDGWFTRIDLSPAISSFWYPSDGGGGMPRYCENILKKVDVPVAMSKFGQKQVKDYYGVNTAYIPHGVNVKQFYRLPEEERQKLKAKWGLSGKFVIGTVMRNQPRKFPDRFMKTIFQLANLTKNNERMKDWVFLMHTDFDDVAAPLDLRMMISRYNLENKVMGTGLSALKGFPQDRMNEIYNLFDCFFLSTSGEGFGIPTIEAMACEVPCVVTDYTTTEELIIQNQAGFGANLVGTDSISFFDKSAKEYDDLVSNGTLTGSWDVERGFIDVKDAASKIFQIYQNPTLAKQMGKNGRTAVERDYDFEKVGEKWVSIIEQALNKTK